MNRQAALAAGFAAHEITPAGPVEQSGFVARTAKSVGVHDPLYARAAVLADGPDRAALLVLDVIGVDADLTREIRAAVAATAGVPAERIAVLATHTHGAPAVLRRSQLGEVSPAYLQWVVEGAAAAASAAADRLEACEVRHARGQQAEVARNRRDPAGATNPAVDVLRFDAGGRCLGLLVSYACHPVVLGADNLLITRDYPGYVVDALEEAVPGAVALFATGCAGQLNTGHRAHDSWSAAAAPRRTFAEAERIGGLITAAALGAARDASAGAPLPYAPLRVASEHVRVALAPDPTPTASWAAELAAELAADDVPPERRAVLEAYLNWAEAAGDAEAVLELELQAFAICGRALAIYPGEAFVEYGLRLERRFPGRVTALAYGNNAPGYLPTRAAHTEGGYEVQEAHRFYGQPGPVAPEAEDTLIEAMARLVERVLGGTAEPGAAPRAAPASAEEGAAS